MDTVQARGRRDKLPWKIFIKPRSKGDRTTPEGKYTDFDWDFDEHSALTMLRKALTWRMPKISWTDQKKANDPLFLLLYPFMTETGDTGSPADELAKEELEQRYAVLAPLQNWLRKYWEQGGGYGWNMTWENLETDENYLDVTAEMDAIRKQLDAIAGSGALVVEGIDFEQVATKVKKPKLLPELPKDKLFKYRIPWTIQTPIDHWTHPQFKGVLPVNKKGLYVLFYIDSPQYRNVPNNKFYGVITRENKGRAVQTWYIWENTMRREFSVKVQYIQPAVTKTNRLMRFDPYDVKDAIEKQREFVAPKPKPKPKKRARSPSPDSSEEEEEDTLRLPSTRLATKKTKNLNWDARELSAWGGRDEAEIEQWGESEPSLPRVLRARPPARPLSRDSSPEPFMRSMSRLPSDVPGPDRFPPPKSRAVSPDVESEEEDAILPDWVDPTIPSQSEVREIKKISRVIKATKAQETVTKAPESSNIWPAFAAAVVFLVVENYFD